MINTVEDLINELNKIPDKSMPVRDLYYYSIVELAEVYEEACKGKSKYQYMWHGITLGEDAITCLDFSDTKESGARMKRFEKRFKNANRGNKNGND